MDHTESVAPANAKESVLDSLGDLDEDAKHFVERLLEWARPLIVTALAVVAVVYLYRSYQTGQIQKDRLAGDRLGKVQKLFEQAALGKKADAAAANKDEKDTSAKDEVAVLEENIRLLQDMHEPFRSLGALYSGALARQQGSVVQAAQTFQQVAADGATSKTSEENFISELGKLATGRSQVDISEQRDAGRELLRNLALTSEYVSVPATISLIQTANSEPEKQAALETLKSVVQRFPEQRDLLEPERLRLEKVQG